MRVTNFRSVSSLKLDRSQSLRTSGFSQSSWLDYFKIAMSLLKAYSEPKIKPTSQFFDIVTERKLSWGGE